MSEPHPRCSTYLAAFDVFNRNDVAALGEYGSAEHGDRRLDTENGSAFRLADGKVARGQVFLSEREHVGDFWGITEEDGGRQGDST